MPCRDIVPLREPIDQKHRYPDNGKNERLQNFNLGVSQIEGSMRGQSENFSLSQVPQVDSQSLKHQILNYKQKIESHRKIDAQFQEVHDLVVSNNKETTKTIQSIKQLKSKKIKHRRIISQQTQAQDANIMEQFQKTQKQGPTEMIQESGYNDIFLVQNDQMIITNQFSTPSQVSSFKGSYFSQPYFSICNKNPHYHNSEFSVTKAAPESEKLNIRTQAFNISLPRNQQLSSTHYSNNHFAFNNSSRKKLVAFTQIPLSEAKKSSGQGFDQAKQDEFENLKYSSNYPSDIQQKGFKLKGSKRRQLNNKNRLSTEQGGLKTDQVRSIQLHPQYGITSTEFQQQIKNQASKFQKSLQRYKNNPIKRQGLLEIVISDIQRQIVVHGTDSEIFQGSLLGLDKLMDQRLQEMNNAGKFKISRRILSLYEAFILQNQFKTKHQRLFKARLNMAEITLKQRILILILNSYSLGKHEKGLMQITQALDSLNRFADKSLNEGHYLAYLLMAHFKYIFRQYSESKDYVEQSIVLLNSMISLNSPSHEMTSNLKDGINLTNKMLLFHKGIALIVKSKIHKKLREFSQQFVSFQESRDLLAQNFGERSFEFRIGMSYSIKRAPRRDSKISHILPRNQLCLFQLSFASNSLIEIVQKHKDNQEQNNEGSSQLNNEGIIDLRIKSNEDDSFEREVQNLRNQDHQPESHPFLKQDSDIVKQDINGTSKASKLEQQSNQGEEEIKIHEEQSHDENSQQDYSSIHEEFKDYELRLSEEVKSQNSSQIIPIQQKERASSSKASLEELHYESDDQIQKNYPQRRLTNQTNNIAHLSSQIPLLQIQSQNANVLEQDRSSNLINGSANNEEVKSEINLKNNIDSCTILLIQDLDSGAMCTDGQQINQDAAIVEDQSNLGKEETKEGNSGPIQQIALQQTLIDEVSGFVDNYEENIFLNHEGNQLKQEKESETEIAAVKIRADQVLQQQKSNQFNNPQREQDDKTNHYQDVFNKTYEDPQKGKSVIHVLYDSLMSSVSFELKDFETKKIHLHVSIPLEQVSKFYNLSSDQEIDNQDLLVIMKSDLIKIQTKSSSLSYKSFILSLIQEKETQHIKYSANIKEEPIPSICEKEQIIEVQDLQQEQKNSENIKEGLNVQQIVQTSSQEQPDLLQAQKEKEEMFLQNFQVSEIVSQQSMPPKLMQGKSEVIEVQAKNGFKLNIATDILPIKKKQLTSSGDNSNQGQSESQTEGNTSAKPKIEVKVYDKAEGSIKSLNIDSSLGDEIFKRKSELLKGKGATANAARQRKSINLGMLSRGQNLIDKSHGLVLNQPLSQMFLTDKRPGSRPFSFQRGQSKLSMNTRKQSIATKMRVALRKFINYAQKEERKVVNTIQKNIAGTVYKMKLITYKGRYFVEFSDLGQLNQLQTVITLELQYRDIYFFNRSGIKVQDVLPYLRISGNHQHLNNEYSFPKSLIQENDSRIFRMGENKRESRWQYAEKIRHRLDILTRIQVSKTINVLGQINYQPKQNKQLSPNKVNSSNVWTSICLWKKEMQLHGEKRAIVFMCKFNIQTWLLRIHVMCHQFKELLLPLVEFMELTNGVLRPEILQEERTAAWRDSCLDFVKLSLPELVYAHRKDQSLKIRIISLEISTTTVKKSAKLTAGAPLEVIKEEVKEQEQDLRRGRALSQAQINNDYVKFDQIQQVLNLINSSQKKLTDDVKLPIQGNDQSQKEVKKKVIKESKSNKGELTRLFSTNDQEIYRYVTDKNIDRQLSVIPEVQDDNNTNGNFTPSDQGKESSQQLSNHSSKKQRRNSYAFAEDKQGKLPIVLEYKISYNSDKTIYLRFTISKMSQHLILYSLFRPSSKGGFKAIVVDRELKYQINDEQLQEGFILNLSDLASLCEVVQLNISYSAKSLSEVKSLLKMRYNLSLSSRKKTDSLKSISSVILPINLPK